METTVDQLAEALAKEKRKNELIRQVSLELSKITTLESKVDYILELLEINFNLKHSMLLVPDKEQTYLTVLSSRGFDTVGKGATVKFGEGIIGVVAKNKKKLRVPRLFFYRTYARASLPAEKPDQEIVKLPGLPSAESQVAIPLLANNELVAVLSVESTDVNFFSLPDEEFLLTLSQQMALSIQNTILYNELEAQIHLRTRKIENQRTELERLNATKDKFFSIIGHDLRSPIASLQDISELIQYYRDKQDYDKLIDLGFKISYTARSVGHLLDNLLSWSLNQRGELQPKPETLRLDDMITEITTLFRDQVASKKIILEAALPPEYTVVADREMSMLIVRNVLSNAIKFTRPGGEIGIVAEKSGPFIQLSVRDNGVGIPAGKLEAIFTLREKKSTLGTAREKGTGLGLFLVKEFLELNKGTVQIESEPGLGTTVRLSFPTSR
jgi:signal transduction histidine kinase